MLLRQVLLGCIVLLPVAIATAAPLSEQELERWLESDEPGPPQKSWAGTEELEFIEPPEGKSVPFSRTRITIGDQSLKDGWVAVMQCHDDLDPVPDAEVVYHFEQMRGLRITEKHGIASAEVVGSSVQLRDARRGASLCVELEARILRRTGAGLFSLRYGPFMRKFLDSYFPMHITLELLYPSRHLALSEVKPPPAKGYAHNAAPGRSQFDAWFRGKLGFDFVFREKPVDTDGTS